MHGPVAWRIVSTPVWHDRRTRRPDGDQRARRTTRRPIDAGRRRSARALVLRDPARPGRSRPARRVRDVGPSRFVARTARSTRPTSRPRPRRSAATARARGPTARCSSGRTRTPCPSRRSGPRSGSSSRTTSTSASMPPTATRRHRPSRTRSSSTTAAAATHLADGIVVTPSHNPPEDGGFKYNPPNGGPADTDVTSVIQDEANRLIEARPRRRPARPDRAGAAPGRPPTTT